MSGILCLVMVSCIVQGRAGEVSLAERLIKENERIRTIRCDIRRETDVDGKRMTTLSRVWFERPDRLRVETVMPDARRIVVDGTAIHKWIEGQAEGVRIPLADSPEGELLQVRKTPGMVDDHLMRLRGIAETELPPAEGFPVRRAYKPPAPHPLTILSLDATGRLARLEFLDPGDGETRLLRTDFEGWREVGPGIWIACLQKTDAKGRDGTKVVETLRVSGLAVNAPVEASNFDVAAQAAGVRFLTSEEMTAVLQKK